MTRNDQLLGGWIAWRALIRLQLRGHPLQLLATVLAVALGVALGSAVYLVNSAALDEFDQATRRLVGSADIVVRGPPEGFDEVLFVSLARHPSVSAASPVLELQVTLPGQRPPLQVLGLDPFRAAALQPALMGAIGADITGLFARDTIMLSRAAAQELQLQPGDALSIIVGGAPKSLRVIAILADGVYSEPLGIMDIATAQWSLERIGRLNRIDLRLRPGAQLAALRAELSADLPPGVVAVTPAIERGRAVTATRAYRVNLNTLALVALLTGAFLVFSTQSLAVLRRRAALGLLRALGVTRLQLQCALLGEGAAIGAAGSVLGALLGAVVAALVLRHLGSGLGNRALTATGAVFALPPLAIAAFVMIGIGVACLGAWIPATEAAQRAPALAMKAGDAEPSLSRLSTTLPGLVLIASGAALAWLPPVGGLPVAGYLAIAGLLAGAVLLIPTLMRRVTGSAARSGHATLDIAVAQLQGSASISTVSLAAIIVSFGLMVAMAIMVHSFRNSFDLWLVKLLPADLQLRLSTDSDTGALPVDGQQRIAALPGVARAEFRRVRQIWLRADRPPVALIAREMNPAHAADTLPLVREAQQSAPNATQPAWISESLQDRYGFQPGDRLQLPLDGHLQSLFVAGIWRDYARPAGAIVITRAAYIAATGDASANEGSLWRQPQVSAPALASAVRASLNIGDALELIGSEQLRERSLMLFDRAFAITYALEGIAVAIGLVAIGLAASSSALARRAQFGMLRHIGMLRRQVLSMLAIEGVIMSTLSAIYGLLLGGALSLILVYVINRQSFNWSIDLAVPWRQLGTLSAALIVAAALTALWSGRAAMSQDAVRAVREDW
ncbi:MAG TPA: FtsX-like permease family protein [Steroidobacteraceae bacterium]|nr:FtsX-like permease family protein [Steroidobacteraceae bacterium]